MVIEATSPASFDLAPIRLMDPAIVARLRLAFPEKHFAIDRVPPTLSLGEFQRVSRQLPFIGLAWAGSKTDDASGRRLKARMNWRLIMICAAKGSLDTRYKGDAFGIGMDAMVDVGTALLQGHVFDGIGSCSVTGADAVFAEGHGDDQLVLAQIDFSIFYTTSPRPFALKEAGELEGLNIAWLTNGSDLDAEQSIELQEETG